MRGSGGTNGGLLLFGVGFLLAVGAVWFFLDSVQVRTGGGGIVSGLMHGGRGGAWETTSMGVIFVPFFIGAIALFYDYRMRWAWGLTAVGLLILLVEILSRIRFVMNMKTTHLIIILVMLAAGAGLMLRSYWPLGKEAEGEPGAEESPGDDDPTDDGRSA